MRYTWTFCGHSAQHWSLILTELYDYKHIVWDPGYVSSRLRDILKACWYLNGGFVSDLPDRTLQLLDSIRQGCPYDV